MFGIFILTNVVSIFLWTNYDPVTTAAITNSVGSWKTELNLEPAFKIIKERVKMSWTDPKTTAKFIKSIFDNMFVLIVTVSNQNNTY